MNITPQKIELLSLVIPAFNEEESLSSVILELEKALSFQPFEKEFIIVDDGSEDRTFEVACALLSSHPIKVIRLSRNFGKECAITAGLKAAKGDAVALLDADGQHPTQTLLEMIERFQEGYEMIYAVRQNRNDESKLKRRLTSSFYHLTRLAFDVKLPAGSGDFRLMSRSVVDVLNSLPEHNRFMKGLYAWVGFSSLAIPYLPLPRKKGSTRFNLWKLFSLGLSGLTSFTTFPLKISIFFGLFVSFVSSIYGLFVLLDTLFFGADLPGWSTVVVGISFLGGIQLLSIGILGEYIGRIFTEVKGRPLYVVSKVVQNGQTENKTSLLRKRRESKNMPKTSTPKSSQDS